MKVRCPFCSNDFDFPRGTMQFSCPKCGRKLKPQEVLMTTEREKIF